MIQRLLLSQAILTIYNGQNIYPLISVQVYQCNEFNLTKCNSTDDLLPTFIK